MRRSCASTSVSGRFSRAELRRCGRRGSRPGASSVHDGAGCAGHGGRGAHGTSILGERLAGREPVCARPLRTGARLIGHRVDRAALAEIRLTRSGRLRFTARFRPVCPSDGSGPQVPRPFGRTSRGGSRPARPRMRQRGSLRAFVRNSSRPDTTPVGAERGSSSTLTSLPEITSAERAVADLLPIGADPEEARRVLPTCAAVVSHVRAQRRARSLHTRGGARPPLPRAVPARVVRRPARVGRRHV
jgi:hypothetical protein